MILIAEHEECFSILLQLLKIDGVERGLGTLPMFKYRKKPVVVEAVRIDRPFTVETMEGKAGDWLVKGVRGECYPVDHGIFMETYEKEKESE